MDTSDTSVIFVDDITEKLVHDVDAAADLDMNIQRSFYPAITSTQEIPEDLQNLELDENPIGMSSQEYLDSQLRRNVEEESFAWMLTAFGQPIEVETIPDFPDDDSVFDGVEDADPNPYLDLLNDSWNQELCKQ
ncbi:uncharacterized protein LOC128265991 [Drosophila gunungcola]|uniref:uncharacterized protein LOC128264545 n=1 Tax=Drosophila gunungcola TaxID=103775 RepID=UPI0022E02039|nr:uncharacterized protein LOC128264545 [Drosophila gunungcola]XP_052858214.1 uncharacterized protein LOC128265991 [Drosophila gunungcola]